MGNNVKILMTLMMKDHADLLATSQDYSCYEYMVM